MKIEFDKQRVKKVAVNTVQKTTETGKKIAVNAQSGMKNLIDKKKQDSYLRKMKKYNPLFPEQYFSDQFYIPNIIVIVDDAVRRGIDVCEGSIGWTNQENGVEILYLYDEAIDMSGIKFVPDAQCDAIYYVDRFDRKRFIKIEALFIRSQEEKIAELEYIAYALGAKCCSVEIIESRKTTEEKQSIKGGKLNGGEGATEGKEERNSFRKSESKSSGRGLIYFEGNNMPVKPKLKWFKNDDNIRQLVEMRCDGHNKIKAKTLELQGVSSAVMSLKTARSIDSVVKKVVKVKGSFGLESEAMREHQSKFIFYIEF